MITPPNPGIPALLLAAAARLGYRVTARDPSGLELGVFTDASGDKVLLVAGTTGAEVQWVLDSYPNPPPGFAPHLVSRATYEVLHGGSLTTAGTIAWQGRTYRVRVHFDGAQLTAEAVPA
jgi:hypothetical protein